MNNKWKILIIVGIIVIIITIVVSIFLIFKGDKNNNTSKKTTLVYWGLWEPESVMRSLIDRYEAENINVDIQYVQKPFTQYENIVYTRISQSITEETPAPDIIRIGNSWLSKFQPYLSPLPSSIMSASEYSQEFYPTVVSDFTGTDGEMYAIPLEIDGLSVFYNKKLLKTVNLDEPPKDWDSFIDISQKLTKKDSSGKITQAGVAMGSAKNIMHSADIFSLLLLQNGVSIISSDNKVVSIDNTRSISTLDFYTDFVKVHKVWSDDLPSDLELFYSGKLAMMFAPTWRAFDIINAATQVDFGLAPVPQLPNNDPVNYAMYWAEAVSKTSTNQLEAWKFVKWLSEPAQLKEFYSNASQVRAFGEPYSRKSLSFELEEDTYLKAIMEMAPTMQAWKMGEQGFVEESLRTAIDDVINGASATEVALKNAQQRINDKLAEVIK